MTVKFASKEINFLKTDPDGLNIKPPDKYFSDLIFTKRGRITVFKKRLSEAHIPENKFSCALLGIDLNRSKPIKDKAREMFTEVFNTSLINKKGIWKNLDKSSLILAFWDYKNEKQASDLLIKLKNKFSEKIKADVIMGVANFPHHNFSKTQTVANALKAADHAAFFGMGSIIHCDVTSMNIFADRLYQLKKWNMAIKEYEKALAIDPYNINLHNSLGVCFGVMGDLDRARLEFEQALKIDPNEVMVIYNISLLHQINKDIDNAIFNLHKAHAIDPSVFELELLLGKLLFQKNKFDQAMTHINNAILINPESSQPFRMRGEIYLAENNPEKAGHEFNKAVKLNPLDAVSFSGYAKSMTLQNKNLNIALSFARNSVALQPNNLLFRNRLNKILEKINNPAQQDQVKFA